MKNVLFLYRQKLFTKLFETPFIVILYYLNIELLLTHSLPSSVNNRIYSYLLLIHSIFIVILYYFYCYFRACFSTKNHKNLIFADRVSDLLFGKYVDIEPKPEVKAKLADVAFINLGKMLAHGIAHINLNMEPFFGIKVKSGNGGEERGGIGSIGYHCRRGGKGINGHLGVANAGLYAYNWVEVRVGKEMINGAKIEGIVFKQWAVGGKRVEEVIYIAPHRYPGFGRILEVSGKVGIGNVVLRHGSKSKGSACTQKPFAHYSRVGLSERGERDKE
jgi:hypothetical protein